MNEYLVVYTNIPHKNLKESIINKIMKLTKDILIFTQDLVINNETGKINNIKLITEKETALYYSDLFIIEKCIKNFIDQNNSSNYTKEVINTIASLKNTCNNSYPIFYI